MKRFFPLLLVFFISTAAYGKDYRVRWVYDGDTILLDNGLKVRYIGINAPETAHGRKRAEPFGYKAKRANIMLVKGKRVTLDFDIEKKDRYGRTLAYVYLKDGTFINAELIKMGLAHCLVKKPNTKFHHLLLNLQRDAIKKRAGLWSKIRDKNIFFSGSKSSFRFHRKSCRNGKKIHKRNLVIFNSKKDAFYAGFAPCKKCNP